MEALLAELQAEIQGVLGAKLVGLYLYGSLVWGDFDPHISDIDLLAALTDDLTDTEADAIAHMHTAFVQRHPDWDDRIEVQYLARQGLITFRTEKRKMGNISPGEPFHMIWSDPTWVLNWYVVQTVGVALFGPPPHTVIDPISLDEFIAAVRNHAVQWGDYVTSTREHPPGRSYAILTLCRALYTSELHEQPSKKKAAQWAATQLPQWAALIDQAWVARTLPDPIYPPYEDTVQFVHTVRDRIKTQMTAANDPDL